MAKKESSKRGYMTKEEIKEHLKGLKTNEGRIGYLTKVLSYNKLKGEKLLAPKTVQYAKDIRQELYEKRDRYLGKSEGDWHANWDDLANSDISNRPLRERVVLPGELEKKKRKYVVINVWFYFHRLMTSLAKSA